MAKHAVSEAERWKARAWQLEQLLRSVRRPVEVVPERDRNAPTDPDHVSGTTTTTEPVRPDMDYYVAIADKAQKRVEELERANLEVS